MGGLALAGPRFTSLLLSERRISLSCPCAAASVSPSFLQRFVISLRQLPGCGFKGLGVQLGPKWPSLRPQS